MGFLKRIAQRRAWNAAHELEIAGRLSQARDAFRVLGTPDAILRAGALSSRLGDLLTARQLLDRAVSERPENADGWFHLASVCLELRDTPRADECFHEALKRAPDRPDILYGQAVYYGQRIPKAGLEAAKRAFAALLEQLEDPRRRPAIEALRFPRELPLIFVRNLSLEQQLTVEGMEYLQGLAEKDGPRWVRAAAALHLGLMLANTGRYREAIDRYRQALGIDPGMDEAHYDLAMVHLRLKENDAARTEMAIYAKGHPRSPATTFGMAFIAETQGDLAEAARLYRFFLDRQSKEAPPSQETLGRLDVANTWAQHAKDILDAVDRHEREGHDSHDRDADGAVSDPPRGA